MRRRQQHKSKRWINWATTSSRAERIAALEAYLAELRAEVAAVEEHLVLC